MLPLQGGLPEGSAIGSETHGRGAKALKLIAVAAVSHKKGNAGVTSLLPRDAEVKETAMKEVQAKLDRAQEHVASASRLQDLTKVQIFSFLRLVLYS